MVLPEPPRNVPSADFLVPLAGRKESLALEEDKHFLRQAVVVAPVGTT